MTSDAAGCRLRIAVLCPHFAPDTAPTGVVMTRIVAELAELGHELHVVTSLPWYRTHAVEAGWETRWFRREVTDWGSITRVNPFAGDDKGNLVRRAAGFVGFSALAGVASLRGGRVDAVVRDVAAADDGPDGLGHASRPTWPARLQHPRRLPRRGHRDRGDQQRDDHRGREMARTCQLSTRPRQSPCSATISATTSSPRCDRRSTTRSESSRTSSTPTRSNRSTGGPDCDRARNRRRNGGAVCGQRRLLPIAGDGRRRDASMPELTFLINGDGDGADVVEGAAADCQRSLLRLPARRTTRRGPGDRRHPPRSAEGRPRSGQRAIEDIFHPGRRPAGTDGDRSGHRSTPDPGRIGRAECRVPPDDLLPSNGPCSTSPTTPLRRSEMAVAGRAWVEQVQPHLPQWPGPMRT